MRCLGRAGGRGTRLVWSGGWRLSAWTDPLSATCHRGSAFSALVIGSWNVGKLLSTVGQCCADLSLTRAKTVGNCVWALCRLRHRYVAMIEIVAHWILIHKSPQIKCGWNLRDDSNQMNTCVCVAGVCVGYLQHCHGISSKILYGLRRLRFAICPCLIVWSGKLQGFCRVSCLGTRRRDITSFITLIVL